MTEPTDEKPLRICLVGTGSPCCSGGLAAYTRYLGLSLQARGHHISAVARFRTQPPKGVQLAAREMPGNLADAPFPTRIIAPSGVAAGSLERLPSLLSRPALRSMGINLFNAAYGPSLQSAIPDGTDAVHVVGAGWEMLGYAALKEARRRRIPITVHPAIHPLVWGDDALDIAFYRQVDTVFAQSHHEKRHLTEKGIDADKVTVRGLAPCVGGQGNGDRFRQKHNLGARPLILFIARRVAYKGYLALIEAMPRIVQAMPDACLILMSGAGDAPMTISPDNLLELIDADDAAKADALAACDLVCVPSTDESFGIVYVEGWLYGKPVIGGTAPAVQELIEQGVTGYTVSQEPGPLAMLLIDLLQDPGLRHRLGQAGHERQQREFTWNAVTDCYLDTFRHLLRSKH